MTLLVVTAVEAEAEAIRAGIGPDALNAGLVRVEAVGVGMAAAAAGTARLLAAGPSPTVLQPAATAADGSAAAGISAAAGNSAGAGTSGSAAAGAAGGFRGVISAGIAGGFVGRAEVGATVIGVRSLAPELGAESPAGFLPIEELGFGSSVIACDPKLVAELSTGLPWAIPGDVLTLSTVTGTTATEQRLAASYPQAVAEAMEGFGVAVAAAGLPYAELRTISNPIGPRDRAAWRLKEAFAALSTASGALWTACG